MIYFNDFDIAQAQQRYGPDLPNLAAAVTTLTNLVEWTNDNSDGWAYWRKPCQAAQKLQGLIQVANRQHPPVDITCDELRTALTPVKAFRTRQHADFVCEVGAP